jgi:C4-dicarboxylate-specific signal transduction histidine kinase
VLCGSFRAAHARAHAYHVQVSATLAVYAGNPALQSFVVGYDPTSRPWYKAAVASGKPVVTEPYRNASSNEMTITFAAPVMADGKLVGVIGANKPLDEVAKIVNAVKPSENSYTFVLDKQGRVLIHPNADLALKPWAKPSRAWRRWRPRPTTRSSTPTTARATCWCAPRRFPAPTGASPSPTTSRPRWPAWAR